MHENHDDEEGARWTALGWVFFVAAVVILFRT